MGKAVRVIYRRLGSLSPETRQILLGAGLAFDPMPEHRYHTFERSDVAALKGDWRVVGEVMWGALDQAAKERAEHAA